MKLLTIDNGNSHPHVGVFEDDELKEVLPLEKVDFNQFKDFEKICSSVGEDLKIEGAINALELRDGDSFFSMPLDYSHTLGADRLIQTFFCYEYFVRKKPVILIDAGTFITIDFISTEGYTGGFIFPGAQTFLNSYQAGAKLPLLKKYSIRPTNKTPKSTDEAILGACDTYLKATLEDILTKFPKRQIIVTGGDTEFIKKYINSKDMLVDPNFIHYALKEVYLKAKN